MNAIHQLRGFEVADEPAELRNLYPRERQIASFVYATGCATAKDVEAALAYEVTNPAVRSMLNRLVSKRVLARHQGPGRGTCLYVPGLTAASSEEAAVRQVAEDFFGGSLDDLASAIAHLRFSGARSLEPATVAAP